MQNASFVIGQKKRFLFSAPPTGSSSALRNPEGQQHGSAGGRDESTRERSLPSRGGWHPASPASRMTEEVIFVPLLHPSKESAIRYDTSSVACGDTFPSRGRTGWNSSRFSVRRNGLRVKSLPLRGGWHPASHASRMTEEVIFVALLHPSKETAIRYDTSSVACGDTFPSRGRTWWNSFRFRVRRNKLRSGTTPLPSPAATPSPQGEGLRAERLVPRRDFLPFFP